MSSRTSLMWPLTTAQVSAVWPSLLVTSSPTAVSLSMSVRTTEAETSALPWPQRAASMSGVLPRPSCTFGSAPRSTSSAATSWLPLSTASCSAVAPNSLVAETEAPDSSRILAAWTQPTRADHISGVNPCCARASGVGQSGAAAQPTARRSRRTV